MNDCICNNGVTCFKCGAMKLDRSVYSRAIETARERGADCRGAVDYAVSVTISHLVEYAATKDFPLSRKDFDRRGWTILRIDGMDPFDWLEAMLMD